MHKFAPPQNDPFKSGTPYFHTQESSHSSPYSRPSASERESETPYPGGGGRLSNPSRNPAFIVLHIKLDAKTQKDIKCSLDDDPEILAEDFCQQHGLHKKLIPIITKKIQDEFTIAAQGKSRKGSVSKTSGTNSFMSGQHGQQFEERAENLRNKASTERSKFLSERDNLASREASGINTDQTVLSRKRKKPKLISKLNVNIGEGRTRDLLLYEGEEPAEAAHKFMVENELPSPIIGVLIKQLTRAKELYLQKRDKVSDDENLLARNSEENKARPSKMKEYQDYYRKEDSQFTEPHQSPPSKQEKKRIKIFDDKPKEKEFSHPALANSKFFNVLSEHHGKSSSAERRERSQDEYPKIMKTDYDYQDEERGYRKEDKYEDVPGPKRTHYENQFKTSPNYNKPILKKPTRPEGALKKSEGDIDDYDHDYEVMPQVDLSGFRRGPKVEEDRAHQYQSVPDVGKGKTENLSLGKKKSSEKAQAVLPKEGRENGNGGGGSANAYEKWQQLITEKRKVQQEESDNELSRSRGRSATPPRNKQDNYNLAVKTVAQLSPKNNRDSDTMRFSMERRSLSPNRTSSKKQVDEVVDRLYTSVKKQQEELRRTWEYSARKGSPQKKSVQTVTFRPKQPKKKEVNAWGDEFIEGYAPRSPRRAREILKWEEERKKIYTYSPYISEYSRMLADKRDKSLSPIHNKLHDEAEKKKRNKSLLERIAIEESCSFQPNMGKSQGKGDNPDKSFMDRLAERENLKQKNEVEQMEKKQKEEEETPTDPVTGQKLFKPVINKGKYYEIARRKDLMRVRDALEEKYNKDFTHKKNLEEKLLEKMKKQAPPSKDRSHISEDNTNMARKRDEQGEGVIWELFKKLDHDHDGVITDKNIDISELDPTTLEALIGVLGVIEERKLTLDYKGFVKLLEEELTPAEMEILKVQSRKGSYNSENYINIAPKLVRDERDDSELSSVRSEKGLNGMNGFHPVNMRTSQDSEKVTMSNLTKHYGKLLGKK